MINNIEDETEDQKLVLNTLSKKLIIDIESKAKLLTVENRNESTSRPYF